MSHYVTQGVTMSHQGHVIGHITHGHMKVQERSTQTSRIVYE